MRSKLALILFVILIGFNSCEKKSISDDNDLLIGTWIVFDYDGSVKTFYRAAIFEENKGGCAFKKNGEFSERKIDSKCGFYPIYYSNVAGTWKYENDKMAINSTSWRGDTYYEWETIDVTDDSLKIRVIKEEYY